MEKGNLIPYHLLESSTGAYIEWLVNEPMWLLIKIEYKLSGKSCISLESFLFSYRVSLAKYNWVLRVLFPPVAGDRLMLELTLECRYLLVGLARIPLRCNHSLIYNSH